jgi:hypothetical protein
MYDLAADPGEACNIISSPRATIMQQAILPRINRPIA